MQFSPPRTVRTLLLAGFVLAGLGVTGLVLKAADHADSPDTGQSNLDINDIYAFIQGDDVVFIMTVAPLLTPGEATENAALNPEGLYEFKLDAERDGVAEAVLQVRAIGSGPGQTVIVRGPLSPSTNGTTRRTAPGTTVQGRFGQVMAHNGIRAWVGPSDDPFYINLFGDESLTSVLNAAYGAALGTRIGDPNEQTLAFADPGQDDLAGLNTLSIVIQMPRSVVADAVGIDDDGTFFLWGTTSIRRTTRVR